MSEIGALKGDASIDEDPTRWEAFSAWLRTPAGVALGICLLLILAGVLEGRKGYNAVKLWRADGLLARSVQAQARGDDVEARRLLRQAGVLLPGHPTMLRAVAQYYARRHEPNCLGIYEVLAGNGQATAQDWIVYTREAFYLALPAKALRGLKELHNYPELANAPPVLRLEAEQLASEGRWAEAMFVARRAVARLEGKPGEDERLFLARLLAQMPQSAVPDKESLLRESVGIYGDLVASPDGLGREAIKGLVELAKSPDKAVLLHRPEVASWMRSAQANASVEEKLRVECWALRLAAEPEKRSDVIAEFVVRYREAESGPRLEAARWLQQQREFALVLQMAEPRKLESEDWFMVYLDAVAGLGDWERVLQEMDSATVIPLPGAVRRLFRLRAEMETHRNPDFLEEWHGIRIELYQGDIKQQMYVAGYAEQIGFPAEATRIYEQLLAKKTPASLGVAGIPNPQRLACYLGWLRTQGSSASLDRLADFMERFAGEFPDLDEVQNDAAYLSLLAGADWGKAGVTAQRMLRNHPEMLAYRTTAALAALREQQGAEALKLYEGWEIHWETAADRYKAVRVAVLDANGRTEEAASLRLAIHPEMLRPEEKTLAGLGGETP